MSELMLIERIEREPRRFEWEGGVVRKPPPFLLAYSPDDGRFGPAVEIEGKLAFGDGALTLGEALNVARQALAGEPVVLTHPGTVLWLASSVLAVAWRLGEMGDELAAARAPNEGGDAA